MNKIKMLVLSLTGQCNFVCRYCYAAEHDTSMMSEATALKAVALAAESGEQFVVQFSGGEPLLNFPVIQAVTEYVQLNKLPAKLQLQTNCSLMTDEIARYLYRNKVAIGVSLDGRPAVNDRLRLLKSTGQGATKAIVNGIEVLKRNNIAMGITCVVTSENVNQLEGVVEFAYFLGNVRRIGFDLLRGQGRGAGLNPPTGEEMAAAMEKVYTRGRLLAKLAGYSIAFSQQERAAILCHDCSREFGHCYAMNGEAAFVDAKGHIYACASLVGCADFYIGNVATGLDGALIARVRQLISSSMSFCKDCADFKLCGGGCFARWYGSGAHQPYPSECALKRSAIKEICSENS